MIAAQPRSHRAGRTQSSRKPVVRFSNQTGVCFFNGQSSAATRTNSLLINSNNIGLLTTLGKYRSLKVRSLIENADNHMSPGQLIANGHASSHGRRSHAHGSGDKGGKDQQQRRSKNKDFRMRRLSSSYSNCPYSQKTDEGNYPSDLLSLQEKVFSGSDQYSHHGINNNSNSASNENFANLSLANSFEVRKRLAEHLKVVQVSSDSILASRSSKREPKSKNRRQTADLQYPYTHVVSKNEYHNVEPRKKSAGENHSDPVTNSQLQYQIIPNPITSSKSLPIENSLKFDKNAASFVIADTPAAEKLDRSKSFNHTSGGAGLVSSKSFHGRPNEVVVEGTKKKKLPLSFAKLRDFGVRLRSK